MGWHRFALALFPLSQAATAAVSLLWIVQLGMPVEFLWLVVGLVVASVPADFLLFGEMDNAQNVDMAHYRVAMLQEQARVQQEYRERIRQDQRDIQKLRTCVAKELERTARMLGRREAEAVCAGVQRAIDLVGASSDQLCQHRAVDAAATMKMRACAEAAVPARFSLSIPSDVGLPALELCAVVTNLIDNALAAAQRAQAAGVPDVSLVLRAHMHGEYLVLEASNTVSPQDASAWTAIKHGHRRKQRKIMRLLDQKHGWGLSIIQGIADRHQGALINRLEEGQFHSSVILHVESQAEGVVTRSAARLPMARR